MGSIVIRMLDAGAGGQRGGVVWLQKTFVLANERLVHACKHTHDI